MLNNICAMQLQPYEIGIIIGVAAVLLIIIIAAVIISHKRKNKYTDETVLESRDDISVNAQTIEVLLVLAEGKPDMVSQLHLLQDNIKYLTPSHLKEVAEIDVKIKNALDDVKIELSKTKGEKQSGKAQKYIDEIKLLIAERSKYTDR